MGERGDSGLGREIRKGGGERVILNGVRGDGDE